MVNFKTQTRTSGKVNMPVATRSGKTIAQTQFSSTSLLNNPEDLSNKQRKSTCGSGVQFNISNSQIGIGNFSSSMRSDTLTSTENIMDPPNGAQETFTETSDLCSMAKSIVYMLYIFMILISILIAALSFLVLSLSYWILFK
ncbi:unnamed protein product [Allacma fusca]|uniref:Uncharacterized protein n=1 Tax=Allacma fusca TaxID=39272 RepID=A0A8J2K0M8_9HEXA|nr:unnamed protein product [Allacma fusca]